MLTGPLEHADDRIARWTPRDLDDGLYVFWLQTIGEDPERWAISPPWEPSEPVSPPHENTADGVADES